MSTIELCEKYFETRDIYKLFEIEKNAEEKDIKKAYYKLSLKVHPDRVGDGQKETATEKFKLLSKLYQVLTDKDKRAIYDEHGTIDEDDLDCKLSNWLDIWRKIFKPLTEEDISNYEKSYIGSELERNDIKKAYLSGKGCINHMMNEVPFLKVEDESRLKKIVEEMIANNVVPEYKIFTKEPAQKRNRRHKKYARESKEAAEIKKKILEKNKANGTESLEQQIMKRNSSREEGFNSLMDKLIEKYGNEDDDDIVDFDALNKKSRKTKKSTEKKNAKDTKLHSIQNGKIKKKKQK